MKYEPTLHTLSNGVTVILDPMDIETANVKVRFQTGAQDEAPNQYGLTHFCEHMLCAGTSRFNITKDRTDFLADFGGTSNACTSANYIEFYGRIIGNNLLQLLNVIADQLQNSKFDPQKIELERTAILDEWRRANSKKNKIIEEECRNKLFGNNGLDMRILGTQKNIESFTRDQMLDWVARRMSAKNCVICISGKISDPETVLATLERDFVFLPTHNVSTNRHLEYNPSVYHCFNPDSKNVRVSVLFPRNYDVADERARLANNKLTGYIGECLHECLRLQNGLCYGADTTIAGRLYDTDLNGLQTETAPENIARVIALMAQTSYDAFNGNFLTDRWLQRYENRSALSDADFLDSVSKRCNTLISNYCIDGTLYDFHKIVKISRSLTATDIKQLTSDYFKGPVSIMTSGPDFDVNLLEIWNQNFKSSQPVRGLNILGSDGR